MDSSEPNPSQAMKNLIGILPLALHTVAVLVAAMIVQEIDSLWGYLLAAWAYAMVVLLLAGAVAQCSKRHVRRGRFVRDPKTPLYRGRMIYGAAWTTIYYCKPLLHLVWSFPPLKRMVLRMFGYRGSLDFTIYPDTWTRDLALLDFGPGTYLANRVTLGTNIVRSDGKIQVAPIKTGANVVVGHLAMIGCGSEIGDGSEVGVSAKVGFNVRIGKNVLMSPEATVDGCTRVMDDVVIGSRAYIGKGCVIHAGVSIPVGAVIPDRTVIRNDNDVQAVLARCAMPMPAMSA
jgi:carbonic anhydrase/acetyltransferase-like protein (isoleucine patch superfamily)